MVYIPISYMCTCANVNTNRYTVVLKSKSNWLSLYNILFTNIKTSCAFNSIFLNRWNHGTLCQTNKNKNCEFSYYHINHSTHRSGSCILITIEFESEYLVKNLWAISATSSIFFHYSLYSIAKSTWSGPKYFHIIVQEIFCP